MKWVLVLLVLAIPACDRKKVDVAKVDASAKALRHAPKNTKELPTTSAEIYLDNLDGQIAELTRILKERPDQISNVQMLSGLHHTRGRFRGDSDEIQLGVDGATKCIALAPEDGSCVLMRAEQEQSLHRFKEARADVAKARALGADVHRIASVETELDWNDGLYERAVPAIRKARAERPSSGSWMREAQLDHDLGLEDESDAAFDKAEDLITDTAPLAVAHLDIQRGIQKTQRGLLDDAVLYFREAAARMPTYVAANEHLAETLHALGKDDEAIAIYENVVKLSSDPEFLHALAELYAAHGKKDEARELEAKARAGYDALLVKFPEAMYWHASEFFASIGDDKKALELLRKNVALRPNSTSYVALAKAERINEHPDEAKKAIDTALAMPVKSALLFWTASRIYRSRDAAAADSFRDRAKAMNPRIDVDER